MNQKGSVNVLLMILVVVLAGALGYVTLVKRSAPAEQLTDSQNAQLTALPSLPTACTDQQEGTPVITSLSSYSGTTGTKLEIRGCNFSGFEGDKYAWVENSQGAKGILRGEAGSTDKLLKVTLRSPLCEQDNSYNGLPCTSYLTLTPGTYKIYTTPWGKKSNEATFAIK